MRYKRERFTAKTIAIRYLESQLRKYEYKALDYSSGRIKDIPDDERTSREKIYWNIVNCLKEYVDLAHKLTWHTHNIFAMVDVPEAETLNKK